MELDVQQIAANLAARITELRTQKTKIEEQMKVKLSAVNTELTSLEKLAGVRKAPGKSGKAPSPLIAIAKRVLENDSNGVLSSARIVEVAVNHDLWREISGKAPPKSAKANMARVLKVASSDPTTGILVDKDGDYFLKEDDFE